jgi:hypothetical protein
MAKSRAIANALAGEDAGLDGRQAISQKFLALATVTKPPRITRSRRGHDVDRPNARAVQAEGRAKIEARHHRSIQDDIEITLPAPAMKLAATIARSFQADMQAELRDIERAVATGTRDTGRGLKTELRRQVASAGLGQRLANSWRDRHYPNQRLDAASLVYTKAPQIIRAFDEGAVIRSRRGRFLAIPTESAPRKGTDGRRISPSTFPEHRFGPLRFLLQQIGEALEADPTLGGLAFGLTYGRPEPAIEAVAGAPAIKSATLTVTVDYESDAPLA